MPAAKRKLATQQPNSSSNDGQQQKSGVKKRKKPPTDEIIKEEPTITTMDPTMECFARMWADEDDDDDEDDQNNVENNNKGKETLPNTSTIAMAIKRKIRSKKRRIKRRESLAAASTSTTTAINYEVIEISDGEDLYQAFPPFNSNDAQPADENGAGATDEMKNEEKKEEEEADNSEEIVVLFESPRKEGNEDETNERQNGEATAAASSSSSAAAKEMQQQNGSSPVKGLASLSSPPSATPAIGEDGKIKWSSVYYVTLRPERKYLARIAKYKDKHRRAFKQFDKAIWEHLTQNIQNDHTFNWKMRVREFLHAAIRTIYPDCDLLAVGSTVNGCGAFNSDMDLCLCLPDNSWTPYYLPSTPAQGDLEPRKFATKHLKKVMKLLLKESKMIKYIQFIPAKVPILNIHFQSPYQTLEVDMNINNTPGIYNSYLLHYYSRIDDRLPALCLVIKHWAKKRGILDACNGFFNSYSLILMVLHFLQCAVEPPILPNLQAIYPNFFAFQKPTHEMRLFNELPFPLPDVPKNETTVGELLIAFFVYFNRFDFERDGISIRMGQTFRRANLAANTRRFKVYIEEPFDQQNTARCVTNDEQWALILGTFRDASVAMFSNQDRPPSLRYLI